VLANLRSMTPDEADAAVPPHLLDDGLRELLFFYLFLAGERLPSEADERLGDQVRRRLMAIEGLVRE
jgi:hypothetical protein